MVSAIIKVDLHYTDDVEQAKHDLLYRLNRPTTLTDLVGVVVSGASFREGAEHYESCSGNPLYFDLGTLDIMADKIKAKRGAPH